MASKLRRPALFGYDGGLGAVVERFHPAARPCAVEVGIGPTYSQPSGRTDLLDNKTAKHAKAVNFEEADGRLDGRKKYLTAKYGAHQMALIRKRLHVEMWLLDELAKLYASVPGGSQTPHPELDLDELLDIDEPPRRRAYLRRLLNDASAANRTKTEAFIEELLTQADKL